MAGMNRIRLGWCVALALGAVAAATAIPAYGATSYPQSTGASGTCTYTGPTVINTDTGAGIPGFGSTEPATPTTPALRVADCTTITIQAGVTVSVMGSRALDLRSQGPVEIEGILRLNAAAQTPGPAGGAGGPGGGIPTPSGGTAGSGPGGGGGGGVGSAGSGGARGFARTRLQRRRLAGIDRRLGSGRELRRGRRWGRVRRRLQRRLGRRGRRQLDRGGGRWCRRRWWWSGAGVSPTSITVGPAGQIETEGGNGGPAESAAPTGGDGGGGSGGSQLLIAPTVTVDGGGALSATGGNGDVSLAPSVAGGGDGADGGIRVFSNTFNNAGTSSPAPVQSRHSDWVTVFVSGTGTGTVTSTPPGISCAPGLLREFDPGTAVTLTATATPPSTFSAWLGDCAGQAGPQCVLTTGAVRSATASFTNPPPPSHPRPRRPRPRRRSARRRKAAWRVRGQEVQAEEAALAPPALEGTGRGPRIAI